jgi:tetratricopeptide (TPR) repeat protein
LHGFIRGNRKFIDLPIPELYDIESDLEETKNLAGTRNLTQLRRDLVRLKQRLRGKYMMTKSTSIDPEVQKRLKSLGYISSSVTPVKKTFTEADDLKTMLALQNRMLAAVGEYQNGRFERAITGLKQVVKESPGFILVYRHLATIYRDIGQSGDAVTVLEEGLRKNPGNINLMSKLGIILAESNRVDAAIELLKICIEKESFNPENFNFMGVAHYKKGDFSSALGYYKKALELDQNYASVFNNIGSLYLSMFLKERKEEAYRLAMENFNRALKIDPRLFAAYNGRGAAYKYSGQLDAAISDWKKTIEINPNYINAYFNIGITYLEKSDRASALQYFQACQERFAVKLLPSERQRLQRLINQAKL